jgi:cystathionine beta-lyase/cystathionine gamma-synthase
LEDGDPRLLASILLTDANIPKNIREKAGITDDLVRLSLGIEDSEDIIVKRGLVLQYNIAVVVKNTGLVCSKKKLLRLIARPH